METCDKIFLLAGNVGGSKVTVPWGRVHIDAVGPLITSVVNIEAETTVNAIEQELFETYGPPYIIFTDRGKNFIGEAMKDLAEEYGFALRHTVSYNPKADSQVERFNGTLVDLIKPYVDLTATNWDRLVSKSTWAYNISEGNDGLSPYEKLFGRPATTMLDTMLQKEKFIPFDEWLATRLEENLQKSMIVDPPVISNETSNFKVGQLVLMKNHTAEKFDDRWIGPLEVIGVERPLTPKVKNLETGEEDYVHSSYLKVFRQQEGIQGVSAPDLMCLWKIRWRLRNRKLLELFDEVLAVRGKSGE